jgi:hypothetical protein
MRIITRRIGLVTVPLTLGLVAPAERERVLTLITEGRIAALPDGRLGEPAEVYTDEEKAHAGRLTFLAKYPGEEFAVIMNATI